MAADFTHEITKGKGELSFSKLNEIFESRITEVSPDVTGITFKNCFFLNSLIFESVQIPGNITFKNCEFNASLQFNQLTTTKQEATSESLLTASVVIENCKCKQITFKDCSLENDIVLYETTGTLNVTNGKSKTGGLHIEKCELKETLHLDNPCFKGEVQVLHSKVDAQIRFENVIAASYLFVESSFERNIYIWRGNAKSDIYFQGGEYKDEINLEAIKVDKSFSITEGIFHKRFTIELQPEYRPGEHLAGKLHDLMIAASTFHDGLYFSSVGDIGGHHLKIKCSPKLNGYLYFKRTTFYEIELTGTNTYANIEFADSITSNLVFESFNNDSTLNFSQLFAPLSGDSQIFIQRSNLGKAAFLGCRLSSFKQIRPIESTLTNIITANVSWFTPKQLDDAISRQDIREFYRQLKHAMEQQGDRIQALEFKRLEMRFYRLELATYGLWGLLRTRNWEMLGNRAVMFLNRSNDYGLNWLKPALLALGFTLGYSLLITISLEPTLSWTPARNLAEITHTLQVCTQHGYRFFVLLDPTARMADINSGQYSGQPPAAAYFWAYMQKITLTYLIFQTVSAFRKYLK